MNFTKIILAYSLIAMVTVSGFESHVAFAGPIYDALAAACAASGSQGRGVTFVPNTSPLNCAQACPLLLTIVPAIARPSCVKVWAVWSDKVFSKGDECAVVTASEAVGLQGKVCCCLSADFAIPLRDTASAFAY